MKPTAPSGRAVLRRVAEQVLDLLFPPNCIVCHSLGEWLCADCESQIEVIRPPICYRCGLTLPSAAASDSSPSHHALMTCRLCHDSPSSLDGMRAYGYHTGPLRQAINQLKYKDLTALARPLGTLMSRAWIAESSSVPRIDIIVPVPLHSSRQRERGYNQAALLARELGSRLGLPVVEDILIRSRATAPQVGLNPQQRQANVSGAFRCASHRLTSRSVLLVDDVLTTGSTLEAACTALRDAGVSSVWACTLARVKPASVTNLGQTMTRSV